MYYEPNTHLIFFFHQEIQAKIEGSAVFRTLKKK